MSKIENEPRDRTASQVLDLGCALDTDAMLERGVAALRASGRLLFEDDESDRALVLAICDAVFPISLDQEGEGQGGQARC